MPNLRGDDGEPLDREMFLRLTTALEAEIEIAAYALRKLAAAPSRSKTEAARVAATGLAMILMDTIAHGTTPPDAIRAASQRFADAVAALHVSDPIVVSVRV